MWCSEANSGWIVPSGSLNGTDNWAGACIYHTAQLCMGIFSIFFGLVAFFLLEKFYQERNEAKHNFKSVQQWTRVLLSLALAVMCWVEACAGIGEYFRVGDVELSSVVSPVIFSIVPIMSIWFLLFESTFTIGGSGIVLFLYMLSAMFFFPTFITAAHYFSKRDQIHSTLQYQRSLHYCLVSFLLLLLNCIAQVVPNLLKNPSSDEPAAWEAGASLWSRLAFSWFGRLVSTASEKTVTADDFPDIPFYLKSVTSQGKS